MKFTEAICSAFDQALANDPDVFLVGVGLVDPKAVFGTIEGLYQKYGSDRVIEGPLAEQMLTGFAFGSSLMGKRPVLIHHRVDFLPLTADQIVSHAAKWRYMFGNQQKLPLVIRGVVGRGWGNGPQHTQSLHGFFSSVPGLQVVVPSNPADAKGLMMSAIYSDDPVIYIDHRWNHGDVGEVPSGDYRVPIGKAKVIQEGNDLTILAIGPMVNECVKAADSLLKLGISAEVIDLRTLRPLDFAAIANSVCKTGRVLIADSDVPGNVSANIVSRISCELFDALKTAPVVVCWPDHPVPASSVIEDAYYPDMSNILAGVSKLLNSDSIEMELKSGKQVMQGPF